MARDRRADLVKVMRATLADEAARHDWDYRAVRPMPVPRSWQPGQHVEGDCSKGVQYLARWAKAPDPMGNGWDDWGNSYTIWLHLRHLPSRTDLLPGDIVTFGASGQSHAAMVLEPGPDPLVWSFGHQGAPNSCRLSEDSRPQQYLRLPVPAYKPSPQDELRARKGWFAWMAWYEGEGDWRKYGPRKASVRPAVPRLIPPAWWARRAAFLLRRQKGNKPTS